MQRGSSPSTTLVLLIEVRNALRSIRAGMRELGQRAGAPVEPDELGRVIRASVDGAPGVLGGGVPGGEPFSHADCATYRSRADD
jgi:phosphomevalonate kinase